MRDNGNGMFHCSFVASKGPTVASTTGWAEASGKRHFFVERTSLCRRFWLFDDTTVLDQSGDEHPDNCTGCQRRALTRNASQAQGGMA